MPSSREALAFSSSRRRRSGISLRRQKVVLELLVAMTSLPSSSSPDLLVVVVSLYLLLARLLVSAPLVSTSCVVLPHASGSTADLLSLPSGPDLRGQKGVKQNLDLQDAPVSP
ncbi:uncharacterized protein LOC110265760 [Arachis ipaensis]|uniref:uncharacterized protein LOC110265760 n=1 Tax=Arachis ipaensis TaxID=130454 RepID=UPI000A2B8573|nr:uncharacterized protein LOC110265760 [Arachis ipaensis]